MEIGEDRHVMSLSKVDDPNDGAPELLGKCDGDLLGEANKMTPHRDSVKVPSLVMLN